VSRAAVWTTLSHERRRRDLLQREDALRADELACQALEAEVARRVRELLNALLILERAAVPVTGT
jgi:hypothetical protein